MPDQRHFDFVLISGGSYAAADPAQTDLTDRKRVT